VQPLSGISAAFSFEEEIMLQHWLRFIHAGNTSFGTLAGDVITVCAGDMYAGATPTGQVLKLGDVKLLMPTQPTKIIALWNNFKALGDKLQLAVPPEPLYLLKSPNAWLNPGEVIRKPAQEGKIVFEGELGIVIGKTATAVSEEDALRHVFGYTCANDVTHADILNRDASFAQWVRAKGFDTFCPFGPVVATGLDPSTLVIKTTLNGSVRQDYPVSDMRFSVAQLVSRISHDMSLLPGDIILCGTSVGVGSMKPGSDVEVEIAGIGKLTNRFE
jgi:2-keto-4-pentenoate hydratase/2-oxohepta-3-ene-1,7-dioic acid hydratase in catechol pathway